MTSISPDATALRLRAPRVEELPALSDLCLRSKAVRGYSASLLALFRVELMVSQQDLAEDAVIVAETADGVVGIAQVSGGPDGCYLEKLFIEPAAIGQGCGRVLFAWAVGAAAGLGAQEMIIVSDPGSVEFYRTMGATQAGLARSGSVPGRFLPRLVFDVGRRAKRIGA